MKGIGKRVTIAFLSIAALLSVSGVIALVELRNLSYDAEGVLAVGGQEMNVAKRLLHSAHDHRRSVIDVAIFEDAKGEGRSSKAKECIDEIIANESKDATGSVKASLDTLSVCIANMQNINTSSARTLPRIGMFYVFVFITDFVSFFDRFDTAFLSNFSNGRSVSVFFGKSTNIIHYAR